MEQGYFEDGTKSKIIPEITPPINHQGLRFVSKMTSNCLAAVALTVRSIQLGLESISDKHIECCRNICPENLKKHEIEHCLDRSTFLPYQGWIFLWK